MSMATSRRTDLRLRHSLILPLVIVLATSCKVGAPNALDGVAASTQPSPSVAPVHTDSEPAPTPAPILSVNGTVRALERLKPVPETFISNNSGSIISTRGGTFISNNSGSFISNNSGSFISNNSGSYGVMQAALVEVPKADVEVCLAEPVDGKLRVLEGRGSVRTDADGKFEFRDVPPGRTFVAVAFLKDENNKLLAFQDLGTPSRPAHIRAATTIATTAVLNGITKPLGELDLKGYDTIVAAVAENLTDKNLPDFTDGDKVLTAAGKLLEKEPEARQAITELQTAAGSSPAPLPTPTPARGGSGGGGRGGSGVTAPSAPGAPTAAPAAISTYLKWTAVSGATSYKVYWSDGTTTSNTTVNTASCSVTGLTPSTAYTFEVSALNGATESAKSPVTNATTLAAGALAWTYDTATDVRNCPVVTADGAILIGNATDADNVDPDLDEVRGVYALRPDGTRLWSQDFGAAVFESIVEAATGKLFASTEAGRVHGISATSGAALAGGWPFDTGTASGVPAPTLDGGGDLVVADSTGQLRIFDLASATPTVGPVNSQIQTTTVVDSSGNIYGGNGSGDFKKLTSAGVEAWSQGPYGAFTDSPAVGSGSIVYAAATDNRLYAFRPADGLAPAGSWPHNLMSAPSCAPVIVDNGGELILIGTTDGKVHAIEPDGDERWATELELNVAVQGTPVVGGGGTPTIYVGAGDKVYTLDPDTGAKTTFYTLPSGTVSGPLALSSGGLLLVPAGTLRAVATTSPGVPDEGWPKYRGDSGNTGREKTPV